MNHATITVVIPVYNAADCLSRCVESLLAQTYPAWQAILVDDGSTDGSAALCDGLAAAHPGQLRAIHQPNSGPAAARHAGLMQTQTEAVAFLDSDDRLPPEYLAELWSVFPGHDLALAAIDETTVDGRTTRIGHEWAGGTVQEYLTAFIYGKEAPLLVLSCWNKLYRTALLRQCPPLDPSLRRCEDVLLNLSYLFLAKNAATTGRTAYHYLHRPGSLTAVFDDHVLRGQALQLQELNRLAAHHGLDRDPDFRRHLAQYRMDSFFFTVYQVTGAGLGRKRAVQLLNRLLAQRMVSGADVRLAKPHTAPWLLLRGILACRSGFALLCWLLLAGKAFSV